MRKLYIFGLIALASLIIGLAWAEQITLTTYYPAPYGVYRQLIATPIMGRWRQTSHRVGAGNYIWDDQLINTDSTYFTWAAGQAYIEIEQEGYYQICANVLQYDLADNERGDVYIRRNAANIAQSLGVGAVGQVYYKHTLTVAEYFNANDRVYIYQATALANRYGGTYWSTLSIVRLN